MQGSTDVGSRNAATKSPTEGTREHRLVGFRAAKSRCIGGMRPGFRSSQQTRSNLDSARAQDESCCNSSCVCDPSCSDDGHVNCVNNLGQESHETYQLML